MTTPTHAYQVPGRGRYYRHPVTGEEWPSITNILETAVSKPALVAWSAKVTAAAAWRLLPRMVAAARKPFEVEALTKEIKGEHRFVKEQAADLGTRVHKLAEAHVLGTPMADDEEAAPFLRSLLQFYNDFGVNLERDIEATEATVINRTYGYAGTGDLWVWLRIRGKRRLMVIDYKTSREPSCALHGLHPTGAGACTCKATDVAYPENGMQTAAIAKAETVLLDNGEEIAPPGPIDGIAILNLRAYGYALIEMPVAGTIDDAFAGFVGAIPDARYLHSCYGAKPNVIKKPALKEVA